MIHIRILDSLAYEDTIQEEDYLNTRWKSTSKLKKIIVWGVVVHNIFLSIEYAILGLFDTMNILMIVLLWINTIIILYSVYFLFPVTRRRLVPWWISLTTISILIAMFVSVKTFLCIYPSIEQVFFCDSERRPRLRSLFFYVVLGPFFSLWVLDNNRSLQLGGMLILLLTYTISSFLTGPINKYPVISIITDVVLVAGTFIMLLYVSYVYDLISRDNFILRQNLATENFERKKAQEMQKQESDKRILFTAYLFHELRNPLNANMMSLNYLDTNDDFMNRLKTDERDILYTIQTNLGQMESLLNDTLDYEKLASGAFTLRPTPFDFHLMIHGLLVAMNSMFDTKQQKVIITLDPRIDQNPFLLMGDEMRLRQIIANYISNAIKFTQDKGTISIKTSMVESLQNEQRIRVEVMDDGIGIAPSDQVKLFKPFVQINAPNKSNNNTKGTGLGLSISAELLSLMKGTFGVTSILGIGSTFWIEVPFEIALERKPVTNLPMPKLDGNNTIDDALEATLTTDKQDNDIDNPVTDSYLKPIEIPESGKLSILVTDDDPITVNIMVKQLNRLGHACDFAYDGTEVIQKIINEKKLYDIIFMDDNMPTLSGIDTIKLLRSNKITIPIIAITGNTQDYKHKLLIEAGATHVLLKPASIFVIDKLLHTIP